MKKFVSFYFLLYVSLGVIGVCAESTPSSTPGTVNGSEKSDKGAEKSDQGAKKTDQGMEKLGKSAEKTDIFLLGQEPKDDTAKNGKTEDSAGNKPSAQSITVGIGDIVVVHLSDKDQSFINNAKCLTPEKTDKGGDCKAQKIAFYLDGRSVVEKSADELLVGTNRIEFRLGYQDNNDYSNKQKWQELLGSPTLGKNFFEKPATVSVGLVKPTKVEDLVNIDKGDNFQLRRISLLKFVVGLLILLIIIFVIAHLAPTSGLLRNGDEDTKWSLARCQMAFWFILIIFSFLFVWGITGAMDTITPQTLVMMGLSSGTLLGAALIDVGRDDVKELEEINASIKKLTASNSDADEQLKALASATPTNAYAQEALGDLKIENDRQIEELKKKILSIKDKKSGSFWDDILSDRTGSPALHRLQITAWTIVLGFIFVFSVWKDLTMPAFSETLLSLMGLSSLTYLGFKVPENKQ